MIEMGLDALAALLEPETLAFLLIGVVLGLAIGLLPGLGGVTGMALLLPFVFGMEPAHALGLMIGLGAVTATSDSFASILVGIPGNAGGQAIILDGHPLAKQGRGAEALGASLLSATIGGLIGAVVLFVVATSAQSIIFAFKSPQLFMMVLLGLSMVGVLSRGAARLGVLAACIGLLLGMVGPAPSAVEFRYTLGSEYLVDGFAVAIVGMGLYAIPELIDLVVDSRPISSRPLEGSTLKGMRAAVRNIKWVFLGSGTGTFTGILPGVGGSVADWIAYGFVTRLAKDKSRFGKGDIRGVIAPDASANAKEGGELIPTLMFGVPGSTTAAMLLSGMTLIGISPGPRLLSEDMPRVISIIWMLVLANLIGVTICLVLVRRIAGLTRLRPAVFTPFIIVLIVVAAFQNSLRIADVIALLVLGLLGWAMKQAGWPRPPLLIGFVLAVPAERYFVLATGTYGWSWLNDPIVLTIAAIILALFVFGSRAKKLSSLPEDE